MTIDGYKKLNIIINKIQSYKKSHTIIKDNDFYIAMQILDDAIIKIKNLKLNELDEGEIEEIKQNKIKDWEEINRLRSQGYKYQEIANMYNVTRQYIQQGLVIYNKKCKD